MPPVKRKFLKYRLPLLLAVLTVIFLSLLLFVIGLMRPAVNFISETKISPFTLVSLLLEKTPRIKITDNRTNFVILGISGGNHAGSTLTDSIIFGSIDFTKKEVLLVSIPRDVWLPSLKTKINSSFYYGEKKKKGGGLILAKSSVSEVVGKPVSYGFILDFEAFRKVIDLIGGIEINVNAPFEDKLFPIAGKENDNCVGSDPEFTCRYETVRFEKGVQNMDGALALKFVRSRGSLDNGQGNDFSRSQRQQLVITAIAKKIKSTVSLKNIGLFKKIYSTVYDSLTTDMSFAEMMSLGKFLYFNQDISARHLVLDTGDLSKDIPGLLVNPPLWQYDGIWVLAPRSGTFEEIHEFISCNLKNDSCSIIKQPDL